MAEDDANVVKYTGLDDNTVKVGEDFSISQVEPSDDEEEADTIERYYTYTNELKRTFRHG